MVLIIGGGLSGLLTAYHLKNEGIPFKIIEARNRIGGRINTVISKNGTPLEMGATWFTSQHQLLIKLLKELELPYFEQYMKGTSYFQPNPKRPADPIELPQDSSSFRIKGGTNNLLKCLYNLLNESDVILNKTVSKISQTEDSITVEAGEKFTAKMVVIAIPPKLWANNISFEPSLPLELVITAKQTHTWMEDSIKAALVFETPFWKNNKQSGTFFSNEGPVQEFYDHSNAEESKFALCGFIHKNYSILSSYQRQQIILEQLKKTFGEQVNECIDYTECVWKEEKNTFSTSETPLFPHQNNGNDIFNTTQYNDRLLLSSTEVSPYFGGYMEGSVYTAIETIKKIKPMYK